MAADATPIRRILSLDGAGIYGLTSALWLQQLCAEDPAFMRKPGVDLFAGTSSGAINSLLLARHEDPREGVDSLVDFWKAAEPWSNSAEPVQALLSLYGLTAWYGTKDFLSFLEEIFGDSTLGELPNRVLVACYDLYGSLQPPPPAVQPEPAGPGRGEGPYGPWKHLLGGWVAANGAPQRHSEPVVITNFLTEDFKSWRVADLAYMAAAMPGLRAIRMGIADGGIYCANPASIAVSAAVAAAVGPIVDPNVRFAVTGETLQRLAMLSLGDGSVQPWYWLQDFNLGAWPWMVLPVNPMQGPYPPMAYSLQAPAQMADMVVANMIGADKYFRLNPGVISFPTAGTVYAARFDLARRMFVGLVEHAVQSTSSQQAVHAARAFLESPGWKEDVPVATEQHRADPTEPPIIDAEEIG